MVGFELQNKNGNFNFNFGFEFEFDFFPASYIKFLEILKNIENASGIFSEKR